jgi:hypothetical protein
VRASSIRLFVMATKLALSAAEHSSSGACLGITPTF